MALERLLVPALADTATYWSDDEITAGLEFDVVLGRQLEECDLFVLLLTENYLKSEHCWKFEGRRAMERHEAGRATMLPVLLGPVDWRKTKLKKFSLLPRDLIPLQKQSDPEGALRDVAQEIVRATRETKSRTALLGGTPLNREELDPSNAAIDRTTYGCEVVGDSVPVRAAGIAEEIGDLILRFFGDPGERRIADVWVFVNTNVTPRIVGPGPLTDVMLTAITAEFVTRIPILGRGIQGEVRGPTSIVFRAVPLHDLRTLRVEDRNLRLSNLRVNANMLELMPLADPNRVQVAVQISDTPIASPMQTVATVERTFDLAVTELRSARDSVEAGVSGTLSTLVSFSGYLAGVEAVPGRRTRLMLSIRCLPPGWRIQATTEEVRSIPARLSAELTRSDINGAGPFDRVQSERNIQYNDSFVSVATVMTGSQSWVTWELQNAGVCEAQSVTFGLIIEPESPGIRPGAGTAVVVASLGPITNVGTPSATAPIPRFATTAVIRNLFTFSFS